MLHEQNDIPRRRAGDEGREPTLYDIWAKLQEIEHRQISNTSAFLTNDLGRPDYDGHRNAHKQLIKSAEALDGYKTEATKKIVGIVIGVVTTLAGAGLLSWLQGRL